MASIPRSKTPITASVDRVTALERRLFRHASPKPQQREKAAPLRAASSEPAIGWRPPSRAGQSTVPAPLKQAGEPKRIHSVPIKSPAPLIKRNTVLDVPPSTLPEDAKIFAAVPVPEPGAEYDSRDGVAPVFPAARPDGGATRCC